MVIVFAGFAAGQMLVIKQTGLAPAAMKRWHAAYGVSEHSSPLVRASESDA